jgi:ADP-ribose pyrophosphatase YjhB (NUDIX family)
MIEYTSPWVLANSPDPLDPTEIDWPQRQARALIPFELFNGRPRCPLMREAITAHGPLHGRNGILLWGENPMADALVTCTLGGVRYVLLIERGDGAGWAMPGGAVEPRERPAVAAMRELQEETGLNIYLTKPVNVIVDEPRWVPDPRGSMEAWAVTVVARCDLGEVDALPEVRGGDDARNAGWFAAWAVGVGDWVFPAHREILSELR